MFFLGIDVIPFSGTTVFSVQLLLIPDVIAFARKVCSLSRDAMKTKTTVGIDGSWNHRRNGSAYVIDMIDIKSWRVVDFEVVEPLIHRRPGNYQGSSHGMEVEAARRMIPRWENEMKVTTIVTDQDSKLAKVIREFRWKVEHEFDISHEKKRLDRFHEWLPKEERQHLDGLGQRLKNWFNKVLHRPIPREKRIEDWANAYDHTVRTTADVPIPHTRIINGDSAITLKQERFCGGTSLRDREFFKKSIH
jgi:hypothetical protein